MQTDTFIMDTYPIDLHTSLCILWHGRQKYADIAKQAISNMVEDQQRSNIFYRDITVLLSGIIPELSK